MGGRNMDDLLKNIHNISTNNSESVRRFMKLHTGNGNLITVKKFGSINYDPESEVWTFEGWELDLDEFRPDDPQGIGLSKLAIMHVAQTMISMMLKKYES